MRVVTWNVNSIRARHEPVMTWLTRHEPDVVLLQETKCADLTFSGLAQQYADLGYQVEHHGRNHYNGVAILSRVGMDDVWRGFPGIEVAPYDEPRLLSAVCGGIRLHNVYVPNGRKLEHEQWYVKLAWLKLLHTLVDVTEPVLVAGDFNVQPTELDVYDPRAWRNRNHGSPPERAALAALLAKGLRDVTREHLPDGGIYTWWNYLAGQFEKNKGMRIDLALCTPDVADRVTRVWIDLDERRSTNTSDHAPLVVDLD